MLITQAEDIIYYLLTELQELAAARRISVKKLLAGTEISSGAIYTMLKDKEKLNVSRLVSIDKLIKYFVSAGYEFEFTIRHRR